jgi:hypothetical protein
MTLDAMMLALRPLQIGAVSLYASWKAGVGADITVQEAGDSVWHGVGRLGFEPLTTNGPYVQTGHPKVLEILRTHLLPPLLLDLPDLSTTTIGHGWIFQVLEDGSTSFRRTATDPLPAGPRPLLDAMAPVKAEHLAEVALFAGESAHLRLAQAALGISPAVLESLRHLSWAGENNVPRILTWPGAALLLPDARLPREAWRPRAVRIS